jgi:hypothetical protein
MSEQTVREAQAYLTLVNENRVKRIVDIEPLLARHPRESVLFFLKELYKEKELALKEIIQADKTSSRVNDLIVAMFRIRMAMKTIQRDGKEVESL